MTNRMIARVVLAAAMSVAAGAQEIHKMLDWDGLAKKAKESVNVNLEGAMLDMAKGFMNGKATGKGKGLDAAQAESLMSKLKGVYVRVLEFDKAGEYSMSDVEAMRGKLASMQYNAIVDVQQRGKESTGIYVKTDGKTVQGLVVIAAEPKQLTLVNILGDIDPGELQKLGGNFGIPNIQLQNGATKPATTKKDE